MEYSQCTMGYKRFPQNLSLTVFLYVILFLCNLYYQCGITTHNMANYGSQLRHFVRSNELVENIDLTDEANHEIFEAGRRFGAFGFR